MRKYTITVKALASELTTCIEALERAGVDFALTSELPVRADFSKTVKPVQTKRADRRGHSRRPRGVDGSRGIDIIHRELASGPKPVSYLKKVLVNNGFAPHTVYTTMGYYRKRFVNTEASQPRAAVVALREPAKTNGRSAHN